MSGKYHTAPYLYRVFDTDGLIYIGSTIRLWRRLDEHQQHSWWADTAIKVRAELHPTSEAARKAERAAILAERPRWNLGDMRPRLRFLTEEEFDDYIRRYATARRRAIEWCHRRFGRIPPGAPFSLSSVTGDPQGLPWLVARYRFHFGKNYDVSRLEQDYEVAA